MSEGFDAEEQARVDAHMRLMARFMDMVIEGPSILDDVPGGAYLFFLPEDDPAQAEIERRGAAQLASQGDCLSASHAGRSFASRRGHAAEPRCILIGRRSRIPCRVSPFSLAVT